eukprot:scaffold19763_cov47-Phaeocystis_antarctica.AAC.1
MPTLPWLSPQVALELGSRLGPAVDVWALGVALHQTCFGANPFATPLATLSDRTPTAAERQLASAGLRALLDATLRRDAATRVMAREACETAAQLVGAGTSGGDGSEGWADFE